MKLLPHFLLTGSLSEEESSLSSPYSSSVITTTTVFLSFSCDLEFGANKILVSKCVSKHILKQTCSKIKGRMNSDVEVNELTWTIEVLEAPRLSQICLCLPGATKVITVSCDLIHIFI